jgi:prepilin-type N-terminal cleavage/methylation domain-containing protein
MMSKIGFRHRTRRSSGFTLIELSIVLVIIGLIVGGILVGRDLVEAAGMRATLAQIEKYQQAVNTFRGKYGGLPGDLPVDLSSQFGFAARGTAHGQGDGDGIIMGWTSGTCWYCFGAGEPLVFWNDLSQAGLVAGNYAQASETVAVLAVTGTKINSYFPAAALGGGNNIYAFSGGMKNDVSAQQGGDGRNYFGIGVIYQLQSPWLWSNPGLTVRQASSMDTKIDDGLPQSGSVLNLYVNYYTTGWSGQTPARTYNVQTLTAVSATTSTCSDNNNTAGQAEQYSLSQNNGTGVNCALSFRFQ